MAYIEVNPIFDELKKCLNTLIEFKTFVDLISHASSKLMPIHTTPVSQTPYDIMTIVVEYIKYLFILKNFKVNITVIFMV